MSAEETAELPDRLLDAALAQFSERGFAETTMDQIARAAGASTKTIYARYSNKTEILKAVIRRIVSRTIEIQRRTAPLDVTQTDLRRYLVTFLTDVCIRISTEAVALNRLAISEGHRMPELRRLHQESTARGASLIAEGLALWHKEGALPDLAPADFQRASVLCLSMATDWTRIHTALGLPPNRAEIDSHVAFAVDLFLRGCGYQPEAASSKRKARKA